MQKSEKRDLIKCWTYSLVYRKYVGDFEFTVRMSENINRNCAHKKAYKRKVQAEKIKSWNKPNSKQFCIRFANRRDGSIVLSRYLFSILTIGIQSWNICARVSTFNTVLVTLWYFSGRSTAVLSFEMWMVVVWRQKPTDFQIFVYPLVRLLPTVAQSCFETTTVQTFIDSVLIIKCIAFIQCKITLKNLLRDQEWKKFGSFFKVMLKLV